MTNRLTFSLDRPDFLRVERTAPAHTMPAITRTLLRAHSINGYAARAYDDKQRFHRSAAIWLNKIAAELGLSRFEVRSNKAGPACSGEVTLHGCKVYVQVYESCVGKRGLSILYRECEGMRDYCGKDNYHYRIEELAKDPRKAQDFISRLAAWASIPTLLD